MALPFYDTDIASESHNNISPSRVSAYPRVGRPWGSFLLMSRQIHKFAVRFPGILVPTYSEEEYQRITAEEQKLQKILIPALLAGLVLAIFLLLLIILHLTLWNTSSLASSSL